MLLVGAAGRNVGKTELCCALLRRTADKHPIVGVKVTTVAERDGQCPRGGEGCGVCSALEDPWCLTEEHGEAEGKDTTRLLQAGARRVFWLRVLRENLHEGLQALRDRIGDALCICESNSLRHVVEPGVFVIARGANETRIKPSAKEVAHFADDLIVSDGERFDVPFDAFSIAEGRWRYRRRGATAIVMAGGRSSRMGQDKALLPVRGVSMIQRVVDSLRPSFERILVSVGDRERYAFLGLDIVEDEARGQGPMVGVASALRATQTEVAFVTACDVPEPPLAPMARLLREVAHGAAAVPAHDSGHLEPLFAVYRRSLLPDLDEALARGERTLARFLDHHPHVRKVPFGDDLHIQNINTRAQYEAFSRAQAAAQGGEG